MNDDGLSQLRSSRQRSPALRIAQGPPHPRLVEGPPPAQVVAPETRRSSLWQLSLSGIPIIASLVSTSLLAYFVLSAQNSQPFAQLQQEPPQQLAQKAPDQPNPQEAKPEPRAAPPVPMPSDDVLLMLIRSTLIALNQANTTGNYTVFREMGAPGFQEANSPAQLTESFADLRHRNLDLSPDSIVPAKTVPQARNKRTGLSAGYRLFSDGARAGELRSHLPARAREVAVVRRRRQCEGAAGCRCPSPAPGCTCRNAEGGGKGETGVEAFHARG